MLFGTLPPDMATGHAVSCNTDIHMKDYADMRGVTDMATRHTMSCHAREAAGLRARPSQPAAAAAAVAPP